MSKQETIVWILVKHQLIRRSSRFLPIKYEVSSQWEAELKSSVKIEDQWQHKQFTNIDKAVEYYKQIENEQL